MRKGMITKCVKLAQSYFLLLKKQNKYKQANSPKYDHFFAGWLEDHINSILQDIQWLRYETCNPLHKVEGFQTLKEITIEVLGIWEYEWAT